ncbi:uncharacterized protein BJ212DRAFT_1479592 [Suillus subaureus]|uniref:Uncharacterized protein n=1 Tax=Suillus subaureus TaxID=48587 RepID=A0A9P7EDA6_9AGAM|nr:uncharacterized protein BJ212DRAFT_1479592 [Suillus subaureus]KAG1818591.1 hypothetical protein BJ212DRAFT_1479592 [Suillus subaureus]
MPSVLHEEMFDDMKKFISKSIDALPYDHTIINLTIHMTWPLEVKDGSVTPDIIITMTAMEEPTEVLLIPFYGECAFMETDKHVFEKMEKVICTHLDIICVVIVLVCEATDYASPDELLDTTNILHGDTDGSYPQPHTLRSFIRKCSMLHIVGEPIVITGYTWCHLSSVEYFVWVKEDDVLIDICSQDPVHMVYGTLLPEDSFVTFQKEIAPDLNCTALVETHITSYSDLDWHNAAKQIISASEITAHKHYLAWHLSLFSVDSDKSSYVPLQETDEEGGREGDH